MCMVMYLHKHYMLVVVHRELILCLKAIDTTNLLYYNFYITVTFIISHSRIYEQTFSVYWDLYKKHIKNEAMYNELNIRYRQRRRVTI